MVTLEQAESYSALFGGRRDAWGSIEDRCIKEDVTPVSFFRHLSGQTSLGIYLVEEDLCWFAAVDIDDPRFSLAFDVKRVLHEKGIPSHIARSRSGNHHVYLFSESFFQAATIRKVLMGVAYELKMWSPSGAEGRRWAEEKGLKHPVEIFPKQDSSRSTPGGLGNYIHIPFFGEQRPFLDNKGQPVSLEFFLEHVQTIPS